MSTETMSNPTVIAALAAALGSLAGGVTSLAATWIGQRAEAVRVLSEWKLRERETLYKEFITEASRLTVNALAHSLDEPDRLVTLYGVLSCIRLMSGEEVVRQGEACCRRIVELYGKPNLTAEQFCAVVGDRALDEIDPLKDFSTACRNELLNRQ
jgi:hypothetical protein